MTLSAPIYPESGQLVFVRQRPAFVRNVIDKPDPITQTKQHFIDIEYIDGWNYPKEDRIIWEREVAPRIISKAEFPFIQPDKQPDDMQRYEAFVNAIRWSTLNRIYFSTASQDSNINYRLTSPFYSAVQIEDYQLYPVLKALQMPRVRFLLADDVGLGKTIEAGLIVTELINQRRIRRILIICPASIQIQWQEEMAEKFNISFKIIDRDASFKIQKELGIDTNPWRTVPRIITSMDYISQPNIFDQFVSASENLMTKEGGKESGSLPWDLIIVDEAHNFMPSAHGPSGDSQRSQMLRAICKFFEHRLFLTATPHNGFTTSFTGLLEILDPLRFTQKPILDESDHKQINLTMIRRLKSEINQRKLKKRFSDRKVDKLDIKLSPDEKILFTAIRAYKAKALKLLAQQGKRQEVLGKFIFAILKKRLLSSYYAFAKTWWAHVAGFHLRDASIDEAEKAKEIAETVTQDDIEKDQRDANATRFGAVCFQNVLDELKTEITTISNKLEEMGLSEANLATNIIDIPLTSNDAKFTSLLQWIKEHLTKEERFVIFTEYRDTQRYLVARLNRENWKEPQLRILFGGAPSSYREEIKMEFNNLNSAVKILIATDTASEGLNLHHACHFVIHQDIPWNPMRLEQRNGRLDRYGQWRDVFSYHFVSDEDEDMKFLHYIAKKTNIVREDLGSIGKILDAIIIRHFEEEEYNDTEPKLDQEIELLHSKMAEKTDIIKSDNNLEISMNLITETERNLEISPQNIALVLQEGLRMDKDESDKRPTKLDKIVDTRNDSEYYRILSPPQSWESLIKNSLKTDQTAIKLFFDDKYFLKEINGLQFYNIPPDGRFIRIGHPIIQKALTSFRRLLWGTEEKDLRRWTILQGKLPMQFDVICQFSAIIWLRNELGELIDSLIEDLYFKIEKGRYSLITDKNLISVLKNLTVYPLDNVNLESWKTLLVDEWAALKSHLLKTLDQLKIEKSQRYTPLLALSLENEKQQENVLLQERLEELENDDEFEKKINRLQKERAKLIEESKQMKLWIYINREDIENREKRQRVEEIGIELTDLSWQRGVSTVELLKKHLIDDHKRIMDIILPKRYFLKSIEVFPVGVKFIVKG